jgi:hypothetical protein
MEDHAELIADVRAEMRQLRSEVRSDFKDLRVEMDRRFDRVDQKIDRQFTWLAGVLVGVLLALVGLAVQVAHLQPL